MCGIVGQWNAKSPIPQDSFLNMVSALSSRGPDGRDAVFLCNSHVALGHTRLSIIDLSDNGKQPMSNEDGTLWLVFNGEIYNYRQLRRELEKKAHKFKSQSDSEVLLHGYEEWGANILNKLRGIFAFAVFNSTDNSFFLARDHVGVKPLYYHFTKDVFIFGSEAKAIIKSSEFRKSISQEGLQFYLAYGNLPGTNSIYQDISKLAPGHYLRVINGQKSKPEPYWQLKYIPKINNTNEALNAVQEGFKEAVQLQCESDVPIAVLLSGGIDSTLLTSELQKLLPYKLNSFNIGFDVSSSDESIYANTAARALNTEHRTKSLTFEDALSCWQELIKIFDEPFVATSLFPYLHLSKLVKEHGFKVAIGGDGADELFAGYKWYDTFNKTFNPPYLKKIIRHIRGSSLPFSEAYKFFSKFNGYFLEDDQIKLFKHVETDDLFKPLRQSFDPSLPAVLSAQFMDFHVFMPDHCLTKVDRVSMSQGLEVRVPFLDHKLIELVFQINHKLIYKDKERKWLLKKAMVDNLPKSLNNQRKKGFSSPVDTWLTKEHFSFGRAIIKQGSFITCGLVNPDELLKLYDRVSANQKLVLLGIEQWHRYWISDDNIPIPFFR